MRKLLQGLCLFLSIVCCVYSGCAKRDARDIAGSSAGNAEPDPRRSGKTVIKIHVYDFPPLVYKNDDGIWTGLDVEMARVMVERAGFIPEFVELPWSRALYDMSRGTLDLMCNLSITPERSEYMAWIGPERESIMGLAVREENKDLVINSLEDLFVVSAEKKLKFGIQDDIFFSPEFNERLKDPAFRALFEFVNDGNQNPAKTVAGRILGYFEELYYIRYCAEKVPEYKGLAVHPFRLKKEDVYFGVSKIGVDSATLGRLEAAYRVLAADGTFRRILADY